MVNTIFEFRPNFLEVGVICRLCTKRCQYHLNIFISNATSGMAIMSVMHDLLIVDVAQGDGLPDTVCCDCVRKLMEFSEFKEMCLKSAAELMKNSQQIGVKMEASDGVNSSEFHVEEETHSCGSLGPDESHEGVVNHVDYDPQIDLKEEDIPSESLIEKETYREELGKGEIQERRVFHVVSLPLEMKNEIDVEGENISSESLVEEVIFQGEHLYQDEPREKRGFLRDPLAVEILTDLKDEVSQCESFVEEEAYGEDLGKGEFQERPVSNVVCLPLERRNQVQSISGSANTNPLPNKFSKEDVKQAQEEVPVGNEVGQARGIPESMIHGCLSLGQQGTQDIERKDSAEFRRNPEGQDGSVLVDHRDSGKADEPRKLRSRSKRLCLVTEPSPPVDDLGTFLERLPCGGDQARLDHKEPEEVSSRKKLSHRVNVSSITRKKPVSPEEGVSQNDSSLKPPKIVEGLKPFHCKICGNEYSLKRSFEQHSCLHVSAKQFKCEACGKRFKMKNHMLRHLAIHSSKPFKCDTCGKEFPLRRSLVKHLRIHAVKKLQCDICGRKFYGRYQFLQHSALHSGSKPFKCETCGKEFAVKSYLLQHLVFHTGLKPFKCEKCAKEFHLKKLLTRHLGTHSDLKPFRCETCGKSFRTKSNLSVHSLVHSGPKSFKCETCGMGFNFKAGLVKHSISHSSLKPFKCKTCGRGFKRKQGLMRHMDSHSQKMFSCETCAKEFTRKYSLSRHLLVCTNPRPFKCETCGKGYSDKRNLKRHLALHSGAKMFSCVTCGKEFARKDQHSRHLVVCTNPRPFKCETCGKGFNDKGTLNRHSAVHSCLKSFKCETCGKGFNQKSGLVQHVVVHNRFKKRKVNTTGE